jgi:orotate phosphoribosyltransferase
MDYAKEITKAALRIGAISLRPNKPFQWASGYFMPIYNDNRKHLGYPENRKLITDAFKHLIEVNSISLDVISGTTTAGIAPAASLAQALNVPIIFFDGSGEDQLVVQYTPEFVESLVDKIPKEDCDIIVSTCPAAIIPAVFAANKRGLPFAYVREKPKKHGLEQQIEGIVKEGQRAILVDFHNKYSYLERPKDMPEDMKTVSGAGAKAALENKGLIVKAVISEDIMPRYATPALEGKTLLKIEDLVSTGSSCIKEIQDHRTWGTKVKAIGNARVEWCNAIFSYDFPASLKQFEDINCKFSAALGYDTLLSTAIETGDIKQEQHEMLKEWRSDAFNWGAKYGFPPVVKT